MDLWQELKKTNMPILLYGMGAGGDKILSVCREKRIAISGVFASDGFARGNLFHGMKVMSYNEAVSSFGDFIILVAFGSNIPEVTDQILALSQKHKCYAPCLPVAGDTLFDSSFLEKNIDKISTVRELLADERSKKLLDDMISYYTSGELSYLFNDISSPSEVYDSILHPQRYRLCADCGGYNGDSIREFLRFFPNVEKIISFEPDRESFEKLKKYADAHCPGISEYYNSAVWSRCMPLPLSQNGSRSSSLCVGHDLPEEDMTDGRTLDSVMNTRRCDYIKYDVEGAEYEAIIGSARTIALSCPDLLVSLYHRSEDIFTLPLLIHKLNKNYRLYLRRFLYIPAWDLNLYAVTD